FLRDPDPGKTEISTPSFVQEPQFSFGRQEKKPGVSTLHDQFLYDLEDTPQKHYWWKHPVYWVTCMPRDVIDSICGGLGYIPPFSLLTGAYEVSGAQYLLRHPSDFHRYLGLANDNGHGWIGGETWGWFSNRHQFVFHEIDTVKVKQREAHNLGVEQELAKKNLVVEQHNETLDETARLYFDLALGAWEAGRFLESMARFWSYTLNRPADMQARAHYAVSLVHQAALAQKHSPWCEQETRRLFALWPSGNLIQLAQGLQQASERFPEHPRFTYWLTWVHARMGSYSEALSAGRLMARRPWAGPKENSLYFEICMRRLQELDPAEDAEVILDLVQRMDVAVQRLRRDAPNSTITRFCEARLQVMNGEFDLGIAGLQGLALESPGEAKYSYHYAAGLILQGLFSSVYQMEEAIQSLERAQPLSRSARRESQIADALLEAPDIKPRPSVRMPLTAE
ncbi:MAG: hypothetical protein IID54_07875, partial [Proteobacteria bacterium]|nr:hypothetical protein [Pseudomonadota bacterium]